MIIRILGTQNGYRLCEDSTAEEFKKIKDRHRPIRCLICNSKMAQFFKTGSHSKNIITVNNKVGDGEFYFNSIS